MESIITIVGFLGAGKTTLLKQLISSSTENEYQPFVILNDYQNAAVDAQQLLDVVGKKQIRDISGSCICCNGVNELRGFINTVPERQNGVTLIEANGTTDACSLMGFLGVGLNDRFSPPIQISVVDVANWQKRGEHNELESNQIQVSSLIVLTHLEKVDEVRVKAVREEVLEINSSVSIVTMDEVNALLLPKLTPSPNEPVKLDHLKAHWSSCSVDLPHLPNFLTIRAILDRLPKTILRVKGFTSVGDQHELTYFEKVPDGEIYLRPFRGEAITDPKLLTVGPGSDPDTIVEVIEEGLQAARLEV